jgi:protein-S-isoprenylcysteine O-methyltransferase Ste14
MAIPAGPLERCAGSSFDDVPLPRSVVAFRVARFAFSFPAAVNILASMIHRAALHYISHLAGVSHLGKEWRIQAGLYADHELVRTGPYRFVRHPIYASMLVPGFGISYAPFPGKHLRIQLPGEQPLYLGKREAFMIATWASFGTPRRLAPFGPFVSPPALLIFHTEP